MTEILKFLPLMSITDDKGSKTAVQIPFKEWTKFIEEYNHFKQYSKLKKGIKDAFQESQITTARGGGFCFALNR